MDWQLVAVLVVVAGAGIYLVRHNLRGWSGKKGCGGGCNCAGQKSAKAESAVPLQQLSLLRRP